MSLSGYGNQQNFCYKHAEKHMVELQADSRGGTGVKIISFHLSYEPLFKILPEIEVTSKNTDV